MTDRHRRDHEEHGLPQPTILPVTMAAGIALLAWGLIANAFIAGAGVILFVVSLVGWIRALIGEENAGESRASAEGTAASGGTHDV